MLGDIAAALSIIGSTYFFLRFLWKKYHNKSPNPNTVATRFVQLFEAHGVHRNQIPRFFGHGLTLGQVKNGDTLLHSLTEEILADATELFAVRREWLDGASTQIYELHHFYKEPGRFAQYIKKIIKDANYTGGQLFVEDPQFKNKDADSLLVLEEGIGCVGNKIIHRFHLCEFHSFSYWKTRAYLTACIAYAWQRDFYIHGGKMETKQISPLMEGEAFIEVSEFGGGIDQQGRRWDPEYMALDPDVYLKGLVEGRTGKILALQKWLELEAKGWMRCGLEDASRPSFEQTLDQLSSVDVVS